MIPVTKHAYYFKTTIIIASISILGAQIAIQQIEAELAAFPPLTAASSGANVLKDLCDYPDCTKQRHRRCDNCTSAGCSKEVYFCIDHFSHDVHVNLTKELFDVSFWTVEELQTQAKLTMANKAAIIADSFGAPGAQIVKISCGGKERTYVHLPSANRLMGHISDSKYFLDSNDKIPQLFRYQLWSGVYRGKNVPATARKKTVYAYCVYRSEAPTKRQVSEGTDALLLCGIMHTRCVHGPLLLLVMWKKTCK